MRVVAAAAPLSSPAPVASQAAEAGPLARYQSFEDVVGLIRARRDMSLLVEIEEGLRLVRYAPGRIEFEPSDSAAPDLASRLGQRLQGWTGARWGVSVVASGGAATIAETRTAQADDRRARAEAHPLVQAVLAAFPGARITDVRPPEPALEAPAEGGLETGTETDTEDEDWDPFDPFSEE